MKKIVLIASVVVLFISLAMAAFGLNFVYGFEPSAEYPNCKALTGACDPDLVMKSNIYATACLAGVLASVVGFIYVWEHRKKKTRRWAAVA